MSFAGKVWRLLVGIKDGLALLFLLLFFTVLFAALAARPSPAGVREGALLLQLDGVLVEEASAPDPFAALLAQSLPVAEYPARDLVRAIDAAAGDERIKAIALDLSTFLGGGQVHLIEVAEALLRFRESGKPVLAYAVAYTDDSLLLAASASEVWIDPMGGAVIAGPGGENLYFAEAFERFGITANVFRVGTFKSAVEPYTESAMSPEARENIAQIYATLWEQWQAQMRRARPAANIALATDNPAGWLEAAGDRPAEAARMAGLVDRLGTREEWGAHLAGIVGRDAWDDTPGAFASTPLEPFLAAHPPARAPGAARIALATIAGEITDGNAGPGQAGAARIVELLDAELARQPAALVVRIDSPGGTVTGAEAIRRAIARFRDAGIPVVVSMANYAASGGYWVATPASAILAEPSTITGSIGVFAVLPSFERLLGDYGVRSDGVRTTGLSGQPDLLAGLTPEVRSVLQATVAATYRRFLELVAQARRISTARADELGQGRLWDGGTGRQLGLVDELGGLEAAIARAAAEAGLEEGGWQVEPLGGGEDPLATMLAGLIRRAAREAAAGPDLAARLARLEQQRLARLLGQAQALLLAPGVQARCTACAPVAGAAPAVPRDSARGWLQLVLALREGRY